MNEFVETPETSGSARRVARNAVVRSAGDIVGKLATFAMFVAIARKLGPTGFGDITFAIALTGQLLLVSGFGMDTLLAREVVRKPSLLGSFMGNTVVVKVFATVPALLIVVAIVELGGYSNDARIATYLIGLSTAIDVLENTWNAAFQAHERLEFVSAVVVFQRVVTGGLVVAVLAAGEGVIAVSGTFLVVSVATILLAMWLLRFVASPAWSVERSRLIPLLRAGFPIGLSLLLLTVLLRVDIVLLSLLSGNQEVGIYGAAFRLFEASMFLSWSLSSAMLPWFSRKHLESRARFVRGYEVGLIVLLSLLTPLGVICIFLATPIIHLLYGASFDASITPLRLLGVVLITYGVNTLTATALAAVDRPSVMHRILSLTVLQNIAMNLVLIPPYGANGAALTAAVSGLLLGTLSMWQATRTLGHVRLRRIFIGPAVGAGAMGLAVVAVDFRLIPGLLLGGVAYLAALLIVERVFFPDDFSRLVGFVRFRPKNAEV